jgi:hypothetical protein
MLMLKFLSSGVYGHKTENGLDLTTPTNVTGVGSWRNNAVVMMLGKSVK